VYIKSKKKKLINYKEGHKNILLPFVLAVEVRINLWRNLFQSSTANHCCWLDDWNLL